LKKKISDAKRESDKFGVFCPKLCWLAKKRVWMVINRYWKTAKKKPLTPLTVSSDFQTVSLPLTVSFAVTVNGETVTLTANL
jgi:hypothetical protein